MKEIQKCMKCNRVFAEISGDARAFEFSPANFGRIDRVCDEMPCPKCGGTVLWCDEKGFPLNTTKRMEYVQRHLKRVFIWGAVSILGWILAIYLLKHFGVIGR